MGGHQNVYVKHFDLPAFLVVICWLVVVINGTKQIFIHFVMIGILLRCTEMHTRFSFILYQTRFWPSTEGPTVLPPALRNKKGRRKSTRIRNSMDVRENTGGKRKCLHCSELDHYKKRCPQLRKTRGNKYFAIACVSNINYFF